MPGHRPPAAKWDGVHVRVNYHGEDTIKGNLEDGKIIAVTAGID